MGTLASNNIQAVWFISSVSFCASDAFLSISSSANFREGDRRNRLRRLDKVRPINVPPGDLSPCGDEDEPVPVRLPSRFLIELRMDDDRRGRSGEAKSFDGVEEEGMEYLDIFVFDAICRERGAT